jgi:RNA polymerase sigma-70 factor (ECF subfamily)
MEEDHAVNLLKNGNLCGLEYLVGKYQVKAIQAAYLILGDRGLAEDTAQSAFLTSAEKIHQFDSSRPFGPWFYRIVVNSALKTCLRESKRVSLNAGDGEESLPGWLIDPSRTPEEMVESAETRREVWQAIRKLTLKQRTALVMRYYLKMTDKEISQELNRPLSAIRWSIYAGHERLRTLLSSLHPASERQTTTPHPNPKVERKQ